MKKAGKETVAIIIVTHNRQELLRDCLDAISKQSYKDTHIFIIDNASTDNTQSFVQSYNHKDISYYRLAKNTGGAGGFNYGLKIAYSKGYEFFWLMDDDCIVKKDSLAKLYQANIALNKKYGFLSSVVLWKDNSQCIMNRQKIRKTWWQQSSQLKHGLIMTHYASFVSFFIQRSMVKEYGLPFKEFFIWGDDIEYSNRISTLENCYVVGGSQVIHKTLNNTGSNIASENSPERLSRYYFAFRNECVIARENGLKGHFKHFAKVNYHILKVVFSKNRYKLKKIAIILSGAISGIFFRPKIEFIAGEKR